MSERLLTHEEFADKLRAVGPEQYHHKHPFHLLMHEGKLTQGQMQAWALNRYYYQAMIPVKDALILSRSHDPAFRREWRKRIVDHDGTGEDPNGGIEKWIRLAEATGLKRDLVERAQGILPGVRYAVDAYIDLVSKRTFLEAVGSSLTELFSRDLIAVRITKLKTLYPWLIGGLEYFEARLTQAPEDAAMALDYVCAHAKTRAEQEFVVGALRSKCEILWAQLDAIYYSYVSPGSVPPGAFVPEVK
jgi:coenzyme PQQ biosynthesis protein C